MPAGNAEMNLQKMKFVPFMTYEKKQELTH